MPADGYLDYIELPGPDIPATKRFYGSVFGWSFTDYGPDYVAFDSAGRSGGFNAERKVVESGGPLVVLFAADLDGMEAKVKAAGAEITEHQCSAAAGVSISAIPTATKSRCGRTSRRDFSQGWRIRRAMQECRPERIRDAHAGARQLGDCMSDTLARPEADDNELHRALGPWSLIGLGIGAIIGAGIFVITGTAAAEHAGPAIIISFIIAGVGCLFAGLCYAEMASMIPVSGSAYTYTYATMGRFLGWFIGWDLVLEYGVAASTVAVGWAGYFRSLLADFGIVLPTAFSSAPLGFNGHQIVFTGAIINVPALALVVFLTAFLVVGVRESARFNGIMVLVKLAVVIMVIVFGLSYIQMDNLTPFIPPNTGPGQFGWSGILAAAGLVFFAYIGFDAVSVSAQEANNPQRDMPIGILGSLAICTVLYILMALVLTGIAPYKTLAVDHPVSLAVANVPGLAWLTSLVNLGAVVGLASVVFVSLYGQSRVFYAMARDGFLPKLFCDIHPKFRTPWRGTVVTGAVAMVAAALAAARHIGRAGVHRHALGLRAGVHRGDDPARAGAEGQALVPCAVRVVHRAGRHRGVRGDDRGIADGYLVPADRLAADRAGDLSGLRHPPRQEIEMDCRKRRLTHLHALSQLA